MADLNDVYRRLQSNKRQRTDLKKMFRDELSQNTEYQKIVDDMKTMKERKKSIENVIRAAAFAEADQLEDLGNEIKHDTELLADVALSMYTRGESVEIVDENLTRWVPRFAVRFVKDGEKDAEKEHVRKASDAAVQEVAEADTEEERELQPA